MEYQNGANGKNRKTTNTKGFTLYNGNHPKSPSALAIGWWDNFLTLAIHPANEIKTEGNTTFNFNIQVSTALSPDKTLFLLKMLQEKILPAMEAKEEAFAGTAVGNGSLVGLGTTTNDEGNTECYLGIYKNLDEKTKQPEMELCYYFNPSMLAVYNYDSSAGTFTTENVEGTEMELFRRLLEYASTTLSHGAGHSTRATNRYWDDRLQDNVAAIGQKVGADVQVSGQNRYYSKKKDIFSTTSSIEEDDSMAMEEKLGLEDIPF